MEDLERGQPRAGSPLQAAESGAARFCLWFLPPGLAVTKMYEERGGKTGQMKLSERRGGLGVGGFSLSAGESIAWREGREKDGKHLKSFMAGGHAVLDAILKLDAQRGELK